jgi:hypothetical protein
MLFADSKFLPLIFKTITIFALQTKNDQPMKMKLFFFLVLFLGFGAASFAQAQAATDKQEAPKAQVVSTEKSSKTGECSGHTMGAKADCKWVDANNDGKCDSCGMTQAECKEKCAPAETKKSGCSSSCPMSKSCGEASSPSKDGKK